MTLLLVHLGMTASVLFFGIGYRFRSRNTKIHIACNSLGIFFNLATAIYILSMKYLMGGLDKFGIYPDVDAWVIHTHRTIAAGTLILMLFMAYTGLSGKKEKHVKMHRFFIPLYLIVYISGLFIFKYIEN
jgi:uncharacterized membrane protein YozB (DUF420 family)